MGKALVTYFSASGVTAAVASRLAKAIEADIFEIKPKVPYSSADLNYVNPLARCNREKIGRKDVPVEGVVENMAEYDTIYLGFPIWYGIAPNVVQTFLKGYDLSGKKIVVFATSGGSRIGKTAEKLRPFIGTAEVVKAQVIPASATEGQLRKWAKIEDK